MLHVGRAHSEVLSCLERRRGPQLTTCAPLQPELPTACMTFMLQTFRAFRELRELSPEVLSKEDGDLNLEVTRSKAIGS